MPTNTVRITAQKATVALVKGAETELLGGHIWNQDSADTFLHFYDSATAAAVTVGTTTPKLTWVVPGSSGIDKDVAVSEDLTGISFPSGCCIAATTTLAGTTAPTNGLLVNLVFV